MIFSNQPIYNQYTDTLYLVQVLYSNPRHLMPIDLLLPIVYVLGKRRHRGIEQAVVAVGTRVMSAASLKTDRCQFSIAKKMTT